MAEQSQGDVQGLAPEAPRPGSEAEAIEANLRLLEAQERQQRADPEPKPATEDAAEPEAETEEPEGDEPEPEEAEEGEESGATEEVEVAGKTYKVPAELAKELREGSLRQSDYSRNMNALKEREKSVEKVETLARTYASKVEAVAEVLAEHRLIAAQLQQYQNVDIAQYAQQHGTEAALVFADQRARLERMAPETARKVQALAQQAEEANAERIKTAREAMFKELRSDKELKWSDERGNQVAETLLRAGFAAEEVLSLTDPRVIRLAAKARELDALRAKKAEAVSKPVAPKMVSTPGATRQRPSDFTNAMARLAREKSTDAAVAANLALLERGNRRK